MVESYEVTLLLDGCLNNDSNPVFGFHNEDGAISLMQVFISQGYSAAITVTYED